MPIDQSVIRDRALRRTCKGVDVHVGALMRTLTARCARGRRCPRASDRVCVRMKRLTRRLSGLRASWKQGRGLCMPGRGSWGSRLAGGVVGARCAADRDAVEGESVRQIVRPIRQNARGPASRGRPRG